MSDPFRRVWPEYRKFLANHTLDGVLLMQKLDAEFVIAVCESDPTKKARADVALGILANGEGGSP
jgi:hypothetical protein